MRELGAELALVADLLLNLPEGCLLPPLPLLQLSLGQRPVPVLGAMDHGNPGTALLIAAHDHSAGRADVRPAVRQVEFSSGHCCRLRTRWGGIRSAGADAR